MKKNVLIVTYRYPSSDRRSWSGISFSLRQELEKDYNIYDYCINPKKSFLALLKTFYYRKIKKSFVTIQILNPLAKVSSRNVNKIVCKKNCDCIIVMGVLASGAIAYNKTEVPIVFFSDCVISQAFDYYWYNIDKRLKNEFNSVQQKALNNSTAIVMTSDWAKNGAIKDYEVDPETISILPMGANIEVKEFKKESHEGINLLFNGVSWERKGADIAIECVEILNRIDPDLHYFLHFVGCNPPRHIDSQYVKFYGFLNRNVKEERELLDHLRELSDFFILPTHAECAGIVFCEACAYGIPSITFDTGGVGTYVKNDINGYRLPINSTAEDFAKKIIEYAHNPEKVEEMKNNARHMYESDFNWMMTGKKLCKLVDKQIENFENAKNEK